MVKDSLESSHSINMDVNDPNEINSLFDSITYDKVYKLEKSFFNKKLKKNIQQKGAAIIRMMNSFLSINTFKSGVTVSVFLNVKFN